MVSGKFINIVIQPPVKIAYCCRRENDCAVQRDKQGSRLHEHKVSGWWLALYVFFIRNHSFYPAISSTTSVRVDSSIILSRVIDSRYKLRGHITTMQRYHQYCVDIVMQ